MFTSLLILSLGAAPATFVIAVGNNQSATLDRPQLKYADDDAVRATEVFEAVLDAPRVELLADVDDDTAKLFPARASQARSPTVAAVTEAFERMAAWAKEQRALGQRSRGYFIFAGHGDVENGEGFIELADGRLTASRLQALLKAVGSDELHVVLDSCNSWFVLSPRKPGGTRFPTPHEATQALTERLPNVGVLLSTSAEAEVYEWSELQSGIFSYALRSGLTGAADVNLDGDVTYEELAAFITVATKGIKNPTLRPRVFARGPGGGVDRGFVSLASAEALTLSANSSMRLRIRDAAGVRWFDLNLASPKAVLRLPALVKTGGSLELLSEGLWQAIPLAVGVVQLELGGARWAPTPGAARGVSDQLAGVFTVPFDEASVQAWRETEAQEADRRPLGVSSAHVERVESYLRIAVDRDRGARVMSAAMGAGLATFGVAMSIGIGPALRWDSQRYLYSSMLLGNAGGLILSGILTGIMGLFKTPWEKEWGRFERTKVAEGPEVAVLGVDTFLETQRRRYRARQTMLLVSGSIATGVSVLSLIAMLALNSVSNAVRDPIVSGLLYAAPAGLGALGISYIITGAFSRFPDQDLYEVLRNERNSATSPSVGVMALPGGAGLSVSGAL